MLVHTMTPQEAKAEWDNDNETVKPYQYKQWYKRIGKTLKGITKYPVFFRHERTTRRGTKRYMLVRFNSYSDYVNRLILFTEYSITTSENGYKVFLQTPAKNGAFVVYSTHCIKRYNERLKMKEHGIEAIHKMIKNEASIKNMQGKKTKDSVIARGTYGIFFGKIVDKDIVVFTTFVDDTLLFENQAETKEMIESHNMEAAKELIFEHNKCKKYL